MAIVILLPVLQSFTHTRPLPAAVCGQGANYIF